MEKNNRGFIPPVVVPEDYWLGSGLLGTQEINPSGNWLKYLPIFEPQSKTIETNGCVSFATLSALEILYKFHYKSEPNYSDRFLASISGTKPEQGGNTPKVVSAALRHKGCVPESEYPFAEPISEYYAPIPQKLLDMGAKWLETQEWGYEWCDSSKLKEALRRSPVGVAVSAWSTNDKGEYIRFGASNHYVVLVAFDEQDRPIIFDSYEKDIKILEKGFLLEFPQLFTLKKKDPVAEYKKSGSNWLTQLWNNFFRIWK